jgi:ketosteroid isomerase-like protein
MRARIAAVILLVSARLLAQDPSHDERLVRELDEQERVAALKNDVKALEHLWSEQLILNAPNNKIVIGRAGLLEALAGAGVVPFSSFERTIEFARVDGDYVFLMGSETVRHTDSDRPIRRRFTHVWKNEMGTWRLYARHANNITVIVP